MGVKSLEINPAVGGKAFPRPLRLKKKTTITTLGKKKDFEESENRNFWHGKWPKNRLMGNCCRVIIGY